MKEIKLKDGKKLLIFDGEDNLCSYCSYPLSQHDNPNFNNQCYSCNSIAKSMKRAPKDSFLKKIQIRPYPFDKIMCIGKYFKLKESLNESKDPAHLLSLCIIHYKDSPNNAAFFANLLKPKIEKFITENRLSKEEVILCGIPDLESKEHQKIDLLCKEISKKTKITYLHLIKKIKEIKQHKKDKILERYKNVSGAYIINEDYKLTVNGKIILLVDDIVSTMASANECSKKLKEGGVEKVYVFALGRNIFSSYPESKK